MAKLDNAGAHKAAREGGGRVAYFWPVVAEDYHRLRSRPGLIAGGLAAVGLGIAVHRWRRNR